MSHAPPFPHLLFRERGLQILKGEARERGVEDQGGGQRALRSSEWEVTENGLGFRGNYGFFKPVMKSDLKFLVFRIARDINPPFLQVRLTIMAQPQKVAIMAPIRFLETSPKIAILATINFSKSSQIAPKVNIKYDPARDELQSRK